MQRRVKVPILNLDDEEDDLPVISITKKPVRSVSNKKVTKFAYDEDETEEIQIHKPTRKPLFEDFEAPVTYTMNLEDIEDGEEVDGDEAHNIPTLERIQELKQMRAMNAQKSGLFDLKEKDYVNLLSKEDKEEISEILATEGDEEYEEQVSSAFTDSGLALGHTAQTIRDKQRRMEIESALNDMDVVSLLPQPQDISCLNISDELSVVEGRLEELRLQAEAKKNEHRDLSLKMSQLQRECELLIRDLSEM